MIVYLFYIYHKPTDSYNYLNFTSNHPSHVKRNIPYCLARRIRGIISDPKLRLENYKLLKLKLTKKLYPEKLINDAICKAESQNRESIINSCNNLGHEKDAKNILTLITTFHPSFSPLSHEIKKITQKSNINAISEKDVILSRKQKPNLKRQLMRTKIASKTINKVTKCNRGNCGLCSYNNIIEGTSITLANGKAPHHILYVSKYITTRQT